MIIWNDRKLDETGQGLEYETLLENYANDYKAVKTSNLIETKTLEEFFNPNQLGRHDFTHFQDLDWASFEGRLLSSSYCPQPGEPRHPQIMAGLRDIFDKYSKGGIIRMVYETKVFYGVL